MKLCFIGSADSIHITRWIKYFINKHDVYLISGKCLLDTDINNKIKFYLVPWSRLRIFSLLNAIINGIRIKNIIKKINPDIIHIHCIGATFTIMQILCNFHPLILTPWGSDIVIRPEKSKLLKVFLNILFKKSDLIHSDSESTKKRLVELKCAQNKIFIQPWSVDTSQFSPEIHPESIKKKYGFENDFLVINACALINKIYHIDILIKAIPFILEKIHNIKFIIVGSGESELVLKQLAEKLKVKKYIRFLGGISNEEMPKYLSIADLYVDTYFPTTNKHGSGIGLAVIEAMSCGIAPIVAKTPSTISFSNQFCGLYYNPAESIDLAKKIILLLKNEALRKKIAKKSREIALNFFDFKKNMNQWEILYTSLANRGHFGLG